MKFDLILSRFKANVVLDGMFAVPDQFVQSTQFFFSNGQSGLLCNIGFKKKTYFRKVFEGKVFEKEEIGKRISRLGHIDFGNESPP
jgi:hypothetical protein